MQPMGVYVASTGEAQMLPRCVMPAGQAIAQLNCVDWIVKAIHLFILFQGNWTDEAICMACPTALASCLAK